MATLAKMKSIIAQWRAGATINPNHLIHDSNLNTLAAAAAGGRPGLGQALIQDVRATLTEYEALSNMTPAERANNQEST